MPQFTCFVYSAGVKNANFFLCINSNQNRWISISVDQLVVLSVAAVLTIRYLFFEEKVSQESTVTTTTTTVNTVYVDSSPASIQQGNQIITRVCTIIMLEIIESTIDSTKSIKEYIAKPSAHVRITMWTIISNYILEI